MKTRSSRPAILSVSLFALLAAACGGQGSSETSTQSLNAAAPSATTGNPVAPEARAGFAHDPARFAQHFDRNGDGVVRVDELPARVQEHLGAADANHDGVLAPDELASFEAARRAEHFARMDANHDGAVTQDEAGERWNFVSAADVDHDGRVTSAELDQARASGLLRAPGGPIGRMHHGFGPHGPMNPADVIRRFDRDGNGSLEVSELPAMMRAHFTDADANHDGIVSVDELAAKQREMHARRFARIDTNGDGALTEGEIAADRWAHLRTADVNGDGRVTQVEIEAAMTNGTLAHPAAPGGEPAAEE
jgi:Ca2+-binding EF-hand superfamily protein